MSDFPTGFSDNPTPLQDGTLDSQAAELLAGQNCEVRLGLTPAYAEQILAMSQEPGIREYCPKDSSERFTDRAAAEHWLSKQRAVFLLLKKSGDELQLVGYGWAGPGYNEHVPEGETTFALRNGEAGQGQGLAAPFSRQIIVASAALYDAQNFWLETWASNGAAVHIYHKLGFATVSQAPGERPAADGSKVADTRIYMRLPNQLLGRPAA
ncbi:MAG TPA: GNAT family N-acetyltransferase [Candidatus Saccharimonadales bacterium]